MSSVRKKAAGTQHPVSKGVRAAFQEQAEAFEKT